MHNVDLFVGDAIKGLKSIKDGTVACVVTGPPAWGLVKDQSEGIYGRELDVYEYVEIMATMMSEVKRILTDDGLVFYVTYDIYAGKKRFDGQPTPVPDFVQSGELVRIPWKLADAFSKQGWLFVADIVWHRTNPIPRKQRGPIRSHEYILMFAKTNEYYWNHEAIQVQYRTTVWDIPSRQLVKGYEWMVFPEELARNCVAIGTKPGGVVLDPFVGSGTVCKVAAQMGFDSIGIDLDEKAIIFAEKRIKSELPLISPIITVVKL